MAQPEKMTKSQAKEAARQHAAEMRAAEAKRRKRNRIVVLSSIGVVVVAILVIVALIVANSIQNNKLAAVASNGPKNMASGGLVFTSTSTVAKTAASKTPIATKTDKNKVDVQIVIDLQCPFCRQYELQNSDYIASLLNAGKISYEVHPVAFLSEYSNRAGNAVLCVANAEPSKEWDYIKLLYTKQPEETDPGAVTNTMLKQYAVQSGVTGADTLSCIQGGTRYQSWLLNQTNITGSKGISGSNVSKVNSTPTVIVDGKQVQVSLATSDQASAAGQTSPELQAAIEAAAKAKGISLS